MMEIITLVQGDDLGLDLEVTGAEEVVQDIKEMIFSCLDEKITRKCTRIEDNLYYMEITSEESQSFVPKIATFDITIRFNDGKVVTKVYQNKLQVLKKRNRIEWHKTAR